MMTILYIISSPLCERDYQRFGMGYYENAGYQVRILDISAVVYPSGRGMPPDTLTHPSLVTAHSREEIAAFLQNLDDSTIIFCLFGYIQQSLFIFHEIPRNVVYYLFYLNPIPLLCKREILTWNFFSNYMRFIPGTVRRRTSLFLYKLKYYLQKSRVHLPTYVFLSAEANQSFQFPYYDIPDERKVFVHTLDYDLFLGISAEYAEPSDNQVVFIDQCGPFDVDRSSAGVPVMLTVEQYYPALNRFFDCIERTLHKQVIIAAHPRSQDETNQVLYGTRRCIRGKTIDLIKKAGFVITHGSTSINFAILFSKPVMLITTDQWDSTYPGHTCGYARALGKRVFNIDHEQEYPFFDEMDIDEGAYREYRSRYIKKDGTPEIPFWEVVEKTCMTEKL